MATDEGWLVTVARPTVAPVEAAAPTVHDRPHSGEPVPARCQTKTVCDPFVSESTYYYIHTSPDFMNTYADITGNTQSLLPEVGFE